MGCSIGTYQPRYRTNDIFRRKFRHSSVEMEILTFFGGNSDISTFFVGNFDIFRQKGQKNSRFSEKNKVNFKSSKLSSLERTPYKNERTPNTRKLYSHDNI